MVRNLLILLSLFVIGCDSQSISAPEPKELPPPSSSFIESVLKGDGWEVESTGKSWMGKNKTHSIMVSEESPSRLQEISNSASAERAGTTYTVMVSQLKPSQFDPIESLRIAKLIADDPMSLQLHRAKPKDQAGVMTKTFQEAVAKIEVPAIPAEKSGQPIALKWSAKKSDSYKIASQTLNFPFIPVTIEGLEKRTQTRAEITAKRSSKEVEFNLSNVFLRSSNDEDFREMPSTKKATHPRSYQTRTLGTGLVEAFPLVEKPISVGETITTPAEMPLSLQGEKGPIKGTLEFSVASKEPCKFSKSECLVLIQKFTLADMSAHPSPTKESIVQGQGVYRFDPSTGRFESGKDVIFYKMTIPEQPMNDSTDSYMLMENQYDLVR